MLDYTLFMAVLASIALLLLLILRLKLPAFLSLFLASIALGIFAGIPAQNILKTLQDGMGGTLGFVATVVGLGTLLGGMLEYSGGAQVLAQRLLQAFGEKTHFLGVDVHGLYLGHTRFFRCSFYPFGSLGVFSSTQNREVHFELRFALFSWSSHHPCLYSPNTGAGCRG